MSPAATIAQVKRPPLERGVVHLAGADTHHAINVGHEDLAVADFTGLGGLDDRIDDGIDHAGLHGDLDAGLRHEIDHVFSAPVELGMATLAAKTLDLGHRHSGYAQFRER